MACEPKWDREKPGMGPVAVGERHAFLEGTQVSWALPWGDHSPPGELAEKLFTLNSKT